MQQSPMMVPPFYIRFLDAKYGPCSGVQIHMLPAAVGRLPVRRRQSDYALLCETSRGLDSALFTRLVAKQQMIRTSSMM